MIFIWNSASSFSFLFLPDTKRYFKSKPVFSHCKFDQYYKKNLIFNKSSLQRSEWIVSLNFFFSLKAAIGTVTVTRPIMSVGLCLGVHKKNDIIHRCNASRNALKKCPLKDRRKTGRKCWTQLLYDLVCLHFLFFHSAQPFPHSFQSCPGHLFEQMNYGKEF